MKYHIACILMVVFLSAYTTAQPVELKIVYLTSAPGAGSSIIYDGKRKLSYADFKATPEEESSAVAITSSGIVYQAGLKRVNGKATLTVSVYCSFEKNKSWMKARGKTAYILSHEQRHFDISYLNTLLLIGELKKAEFTAEDCMPQLKKYYLDAIDRMEAMQEQYDAETNNGILTERQKEWDEKIESQLNAMGKLAAL